MSGPEPTTAVVICRDRVVYADRCVRALAASPGVSDIHIVDHGSTWPDMRTWLGTMDGEVDITRHSTDGRLLLEKAFRMHVHRMPNAHPRDLWTNGTLADIVAPGERFLVTDCDIVVPTDWRGADWLAELHCLLDVRPDVIKAGLQLSLAIPPEHPHRRRVIEWESEYRREDQRRMYGIGEQPIGRQQIGQYFDASVDTTIALYRRLEPYNIDPAVRTAHPHHEALHLPWLETGPETPELAWYRERAQYGHWREPDGFVDEHK